MAGRRSSLRRIIGLGAVLVWLVVVSGCERPPPPEAAVRLSGDQIELLYVGCTVPSIAKIVIVDGRDVIHDDDDPIMWQVSFDPATTQESFIAGQAPTGGHEDVPLSAVLQPDEQYFFTIYFADGYHDGVGFHVDTLAGGVIAWDGYVEPGDFAKRTQCPRSSLSQERSGDYPL